MEIMWYNSFKELQRGSLRKRGCAASFGGPHKKHRLFAGKAGDFAKTILQVCGSFLAEMVRYLRLLPWKSGKVEGLSHGKVKKLANQRSVACPAGQDVLF